MAGDGFAAPPQLGNARNNNKTRAGRRGVGGGSARLAQGRRQRRTPRERARERRVGAARRVNSGQGDESKLVIGDS